MPDKIYVNLLLILKTAVSECFTKCNNIFTFDVRRRKQTFINMDVLFDEIPEDKQERTQEAAADCAVAAIKEIR